MFSRVDSREDQPRSPIRIIRESDDDLSKRRVERANDLKRRFDFVWEAASEYPGSATFPFLEIVRYDLDNFDPTSIRRRRWLQIAKYRIPLPSQNG